MSLSLELYNKDDLLLKKSDGVKEVNLVYDDSYKEGDYIILKSEKSDVFLWLCLDEAIGRSMVYLKEKIFRYDIPFRNKRFNISPKAFYGAIHLLTVKSVKDYEITQYRNIAINLYDHHNNINSIYPHASANIETRGEVVFAAKNVIDGITANKGHGNYPYQSWGINQRDDAKLRLEFGKKVAVDKIVLYTRADFPHDNWWEKATITFSDNTKLEMKMQKSDFPHEFSFKEKQVEWLELDELIKSPDESPFPALTQLEVYGKYQV